MYSKVRKNIDIVAEYCDRMIRGDFSALEDFVSQEWITHAMPTVLLPSFATAASAIEGEKIFFQQVIQAFPQRELILNKNMAVGDDYVVINYTIVGVHNGAKFFNVYPSGNQERIEGTAIFRLEAGKIVEHWGGPTCCTCTGYVNVLI
jgi:predicted ester cyclase